MPLEIKQHTVPHLKGLNSGLELSLSNEKLYDVLSQGASKLPKVKDLELCTLLNKRGLFGNF